MPNVQRASVFLDRFIERKMAGAKREERITGCVPLAVCPKKPHRNNVAVVGDAARQANPLTAGGIMNTFEAADCLVRALIARGRFTASVPCLDAYGRAWAKQRFTQRVFFRVKELFLAMTEEQISAIIDKAAASAGGRFTANKPFTFSPAALLRLFVVMAPVVIGLARKRPRSL